MSKFEKDMCSVETAIREELGKHGTKNFPKPEDFCVSLPKGIDHEVIAYYKGKGWKFVNGGPDCDYLRFK